MEISMFTKFWQDMVPLAMTKPASLSAILCATAGWGTVWLGTVFIIPLFLINPVFKSVRERHFSRGFHARTLTDLCLDYYRKKGSLLVAIVSDILTMTFDRVDGRDGTWVLPHHSSRSLWTQILKSALLSLVVNMFEHNMRSPRPMFWSDSDWWQYKFFQRFFFCVMIILVTFLINSLWRQSIFSGMVGDCSRSAEGKRPSVWPHCRHISTAVNWQPKPIKSKPTKSKSIPKPIKLKNDWYSDFSFRYRNSDLGSVSSPVYIVYYMSKNSITTFELITVS